MTPGYLFDRMKWFSAIFLANQEFYGESGNGESNNWIVSLIWRGETSWIITITTDTLYSLGNGSKWSMHRLYCELVLVWRDYLGKRTRRTYWSTWNGGDGGLEYETVVVWLVVDGWLLWEWDETLGNWGTCVGEYARHKKSSNRTETLSSSYLRGRQFLRCAHIPVYVDNPETSYRLPFLPQLPPLVSRIQFCIV